jgi:hypothetical protein
MDKINLVGIIIATIIINEIKCVPYRDENTKEQQKVMQKGIFQNRFEISRMNSRLRRSEASMKNVTNTNNKTSSKGNVLMRSINCYMKTVCLNICYLNYSESNIKYSINLRLDLNILKLSYDKNSMQT